MTFNKQDGTEKIRVYLVDGFFQVNHGRLPEYKKYSSVKRYLQDRGFNTEADDVEIRLA